MAWHKLTRPKEIGGWGIKEGILFGKALAGRSL
jgi:hypothetical protein